MEVGDYIMPSFVLIQWIIVGVIVGFHFLIGFLRGPQKSIYYTAVSLITTVATLFLISLISANLLFKVWPYANILNSINSMLGGSLESFLPVLLDASVSGIVVLVIDIVLRLVLYFLLYPLIKLLLTLIIFRPIWKGLFEKRLLKKEIKEEVVRSLNLDDQRDDGYGARKTVGRFVGALFGGFRGLIAAFIFLLPILFIASSVGNVNLTSASINDENIHSLASGEESAVEIPSQVQEILDQIDEMNKNGLGSLTSKIMMTDNETGDEISFDQFVFDKVFTFKTTDVSGEVSDTKVKLGREVSNLTGIFGILIDGGYLESDFDYTTISSANLADIENIMGYIQNSNLITSMIPSAVNFGSIYFLEDQLDFNLDDYTSSQAALDSLIEADWGAEFNTLYVLIESALEFGSVNEIMAYLDDPASLATLTPEQGVALGNIIRSAGNLQLTAAVDFAVEYLTTLESVQSNITWVEETQREAYLRDQFADVISTDTDYFTGENGTFYQIASLIDTIFSTNNGDSNLANIVESDFDPSVILASDNATWVSAVLAELTNVQLIINAIPMGVDYALFSANDGTFDQDMIDGLTADLADIPWGDELTNVGDIYAEILKLGLSSIFEDNPDYVAYIDTLASNNIDTARIVVNKIFEDSQFVNAVLENLTPALIERFVTDEDLRVAVESILLDEQGGYDFSIGSEINNILTVVEAIYEFTDINELTSIADASLQEQTDLLVNFASMDSEAYDRLLAAINDLQSLNKADADALSAIVTSFGLEEDVYVPSTVALNHDVVTLIDMVHEFGVYLNDDLDTPTMIDLTPYLSTLQSQLLDAGVRSDLVYYNLLNQFQKQIQNESLSDFVAVPAVIKDADVESITLETEFNGLIEAVFNLLMVTSEADSIDLSINGISNIVADPMSVPVEVITQFTDAQLASDAFSSFDHSLVFKASVSKAVSYAGTQLAPSINDYNIALPMELTDTEGNINDGVIADFINTLATVAVGLNESLGYSTINDVIDAEASMYDYLDAYNQLSDEVVVKLGTNPLIKGVVNEALFASEIQSFIQTTINDMDLGFTVDSEFMSLSRTNNKLGYSELSDLLLVAKSFQVSEALINDIESEIFSVLQNMSSTDIERLGRARLLNELATSFVDHSDAIVYGADLLTQMYDDSLKPQITSFIDSLEGSSLGASLADVIDAVDSNNLLDSPDFELLINNIFDYRDGYGNVTLLDNVGVLIEAFKETDVYTMSDLEDYLNMGKLNHLVSSTAFVDKLFKIDFLYENVNESLKSEDVYDSLANALTTAVSTLGYDVTFAGESISLADIKYGIYNAEGELNIDEIKKLLVVGTNYDWSQVDTSSTEAILASAQDVLFSAGFSGQRTVDAIFESNIVVALFDRLLNFKYNDYTSDMVDVVNQIVTDAGIDVTIPIEMLYYDDSAFENEVIAKEALVQIVDIMQYIDFSEPLGIETIHQMIKNNHAGAIVASPIISSLITNVVQSEDIQNYGIDLANEYQTYYLIPNGYYALPTDYVTNGLVNEQFIVDVLTIGYISYRGYEVAQANGVIDLVTSGADTLDMVDELLTDYMGSIKEIVGIIFNEERVNETLERAIPSVLSTYPLEDAQLQAILEEILLDGNNELAFDIETEIYRLLDIANIAIKVVDLGQIDQIDNVDSINQIVYDLGSLSDAQYQVLVNLVESSEILSRADQATAAYLNDKVVELLGNEVYIPDELSFNHDVATILNLVREVSLYVVEQEDMSIELEDIDILPLLASGKLQQYLVEDSENTNSNLLFYNMIYIVKHANENDLVADYVTIPTALTNQYVEGTTWQTEMNTLIESIFAVGRFAEGTDFTLSYNDIMDYTSGAGQIGNIPVELVTQFADATRVEEVFGPLFDSLIVKANVADYVSLAGEMVAPMINDYQLAVPQDMIDTNGYVDGAAFLDLIHAAATLASEMNATLGYQVLNDVLNIEEDAFTYVEAYNQTSDATLVQLGTNDLFYGMLSDALLDSTIQSFIRTTFNDLNLGIVADSQFMTITRVTPKLDAHEISDLLLFVKALELNADLFTDADLALAYAQGLTDARLNQIENTRLVNEIITQVIEHTDAVTYAADLLTQLYDDQVEPQIQSFVDSFDASSQISTILTDIKDNMGTPDFVEIINNVVSYRDLHGNYDLSQLTTLIKAFQETDIYAVADVEDYYNLAKVNHLVSNTMFIDYVFASEFVYDNLNEALKSEDGYDALAENLATAISDFTGVSVTITGADLSIADVKYGIYNAEGKLNIDEIKQLAVAATNYDWTLFETSSVEAILASVQDMLFSVGFNGQVNMDAIFDSQIVIALFDKLLNFKYGPLTSSDLVAVAEQMLSDYTAIDIDLEDELLLYDETAFDVNQIIKRESIVSIFEVLQYLDFSEPLGADTFYSLVTYHHVDTLVASPIITSLITNVLQSNAVQNYGIDLANANQTYYLIPNGHYALPAGYLTNGLVNEQFASHVLTGIHVGYQMYEIAVDDGIVDLVTSGADPMVIVDELLTDHMGSIKEMISMAFANEEIALGIEDGIPSLLTNYLVGDSQLDAVLDEILLDGNNELAFDIETEIYRLLDVVNILIKTVDLGQIDNIGTVDGIDEIAYSFGSLSDAQYQVLINLIESSEILSRAGQDTMTYLADLTSQYTVLEVYVPSSVSLNYELSAIFNIVREITVYVAQQEDLGVDLEDIDVTPLFASSNLKQYLVEDSGNMNSNLIFYNMISLLKYEEDNDAIAAYISIPSILQTATIENTLWKNEMNLLIEAVFEIIPGLVQDVGVELSYNSVMDYTTNYGSLPINIVTQFANTTKVDDTFGALSQSYVVRATATDLMNLYGDAYSSSTFDYKIKVPTDLTTNGMINSGVMTDFVYGLAMFVAGMDEAYPHYTINGLISRDTSDHLYAFNHMEETYLEAFVESDLVKGVIEKALLSPTFKHGVINMLNDMQDIITIDLTLLDVDESLKNEANNGLADGVILDMFQSIQAFGLANFSDNMLDTFLAMVGRNEVGGVDDLDRFLASDYLYSIIDSALLMDSVSSLIADQLGSALNIDMSGFDLSYPASALGTVGIEAGRVPREEIKKIVTSISLIDFDTIGIQTFTNLVDVTQDPDDFATFIASDYIYNLLAKLFDNSGFQGYIGDQLSAPLGGATIDMSVPTDAQGSAGIENGLISRVELRYIMISFSLLDLDNMSVNSILDLFATNSADYLNTADDFELFLTSTYLQDKVSQLLLSQTIVETIANGNFTFAEFTLPASAFVSGHLTQQQLYDTFNGVNILGITDFDNVTIGIDTLINATSTDITALLLSDYMYRVMDLYIKAQDPTNLEIPADALETTGDFSGWVKQTEITNLFTALQTLGNDPNTYDFTAITQADMLTLLDADSVIVNQMISNEAESALQSVVNVGFDNITLPEAYETSVNRLLVDEMKALVSAMDPLGMTNLSGSFAVTSINTTTLQALHDLGLGNPTVDPYDSYLIHYLISDRMEVALTVSLATVPLAYTTGTLGTAIINPDEIQALIGAMDEMGVSDLSNPSAFSADNLTYTALQAIHDLGLGDPTHAVTPYDSYVINHMISNGIKDAITDRPSTIYLANGDITGAEIQGVISALAVFDPTHTMALTDISFANTSLSVGTITDLIDLESYLVDRQISAGIIAAGLDVLEAYETDLGALNYEGVGLDLNIDEMLALDEAMAVMGLTDLSATFSATNLSTTDLQNLHNTGLGDPSHASSEYDSYIVHNLISDALVNALPIVGHIAYINTTTPDYITAQEVQNFIYDLVDLGIANIGAFASTISDSTSILANFSDTATNAIFDRVDSDGTTLMYYVLDHYLDPSDTTLTGVSRYDDTTGGVTITLVDSSDLRNFILNNNV